MKKTIKYLTQIGLVLGLAACATKKMRIDKDGIRGTLSTPQFTECYQKYLKSGGTNEGKVILQWEIIETGAVQNISIKEDTLMVDAVSRCMQNVLGKLKFDPGKMVKGERAVVVFPWVFRFKTQD